jgi:hypothetical protein
MKPLYIFDIDGTITDVTHRLHYLDSNNWDAFYDAVLDDKPYWDVIDLLVDLSMLNDIWFFTGRRESCRVDTVKWICKYMPYFAKKNKINITMRPNNNTIQDYKLKQEMLDNMLLVDVNRLVGVFDDRQQVVDMWRSNGIRCFQVAPGNF